MRKMRRGLSQRMTRARTVSPPRIARLGSASICFAPRLDLFERMAAMTSRLTLLLAMGLFVFSVALAGCNTIEGAGEDVEALGENIEQVAED